MALQFGNIATIVTGLVEGAKLLSSGTANASGTKADKVDVTTALKNRVSQLERHEADQNVLVERLAEQLKELAAAGDRLNSRVMMLLVVSGVALVVSLVSLLLALLWR